MSEPQSQPSQAHTATTEFECSSEVVVIRANGTRIPLGDITVEAAPKNAIIKWLWIANIQMKLHFPWLYGYGKPKE